MVNRRSFLRRSAQGAAAVALASSTIVGVAPSVEAQSSPVISDVPSEDLLDIGTNQTMGSSDYEVVSNRAHYKQLMQLHRNQLVTGQEVMDFVSTHALQFRPLPAIVPGSRMKISDHNRLLERINALSALA